MDNLATTVDVLNLFGDPTRVRLMSLLAREELSVAELTNVTQVPQSRVSTHLGKLREADILRDRRVGTATFYSLNDASMPDQARKVWSLLSSQVDDAVLESDRKRCEAVLRARNGNGRWPDVVAGEMERHYSPGRTWESMARGFAALMQLGDVLDVGAGDGTIAEMLAPRATSYTALDVSEKLVEAAKKRLGDRAKCIVGDAHQLKFYANTFDQVLLFNVLASCENPGKVIREAARVARKSVVVVTLDAHEYASVTAAYHHVHAGFKPATIRRHLEKAGLSVEQCEVTSRERRAPHFAVVTAVGVKT
jgi:DNA-binding transcriptional ArsR family regulator/2-polyprenyl-3-methyl-5-hydroxy-6-metoxy-1,4-benzoquinol methylase